MSLAAPLSAPFEGAPLRSHKHKLHVALATTVADVRAAQRLRHQVFVDEMGARLDCDEPGIEGDRFDPFCHHLLVRDNESDRVVGCYRILTDTQARKAGGYYSQSEFDLTRVLAIPGRFMEVGRTCVHPDYRSGATIALLWSGLARYMIMNKFDYLMGCASIPLGGETRSVAAMYQQLACTHLSPAEWRVFPHTPLPRTPRADTEPAAVPALIKGYLRAGAKICGEPAWDRQFNVADLFILLRVDGVDTRYARHFIGRG